MLTIFRLAIAFAGAFFFATQVSAAQTVAEVKKKASLQVIERMAAGQPQDVIVVFDDKPMRREAAVMQATRGLPSAHRELIEFKAARYAEKKHSILSAFAEHEANVLKPFSHLPLAYVRIHSRQALDRLLARPEVMGIFENRVMRRMLAQSLPLIGQPEAAAQGHLGAGTTVAVLDTGVNYTHPAFGSCAAPGVPAGCKVVVAQDFAPEDGQLDDDGHGSSVAGIVLGVAPGTQIAALDVFDSDGSAYDSDIISAVNWAIANKSVYNIVAINLSLGSIDLYFSPVTADPYKSIVDNARAAGILTVAASGNDGNSAAISVPAAIDGVISVGAVYDAAVGAVNWTDCTDLITAADRVTCFSNSASFLTLLAPGATITAAGLSQGGTSLATPHVAGAVAVLRAAFPTETLDQTVARLTNGVPVRDRRNGIVKPRLSLPAAFGLVVSNPGWWWNPAEGGRGFTIEQQGNNIFMAGFLYDVAGRATWYAAGPAPINGTTFTSTLTEFSGGQSLTGTYQAPTSTRNIGNISITFSDPSHGTLTWPGGTLPIQRFDFGPGGASAVRPLGTPETGWWWNAAEGGRGFSIEIQGSTMFLGGFMYDPRGNPIWYISGPMATINSTSYQGAWNEYGNGQTLAGLYQPASLVNANVGAVTLQFSSTTTATLTLPDGRQIPLTRYRF